MAVRLFVGNLSYDVTEADLQSYFSAVGRVSFVSIPKDRETNKPRGFAFVEFNDQSEANEAIRRFNGQPFKGRNLAINEARERDSSPRPSAPPRPYSPRPSFSADQGLGGPPPLSSEKPSRNFGPDAAPRRARKQPPRGKAQGGPKQPLREKTGGRFFGGDDEPFDDDLDTDNFATSLGDHEAEEEENE